MRHLLLSTILALGAFALTPENALACSCAPFDSPGISPKAWFDRFDGAAFRGPVVKVETVQTGKPEPDQQKLKLTFRVERHWKGVNDAEVVIWTDSAPDSCAIEYPLNRPLMIFAFRRNGRLETHMCDWTMPAPSWEIPGILGRGLPPPKK
jgi:hypothetical protein